MTLHEYLETKRRSNIATLNASGACHICGSTCRSIHGFNAAMLGDPNTTGTTTGHFNELSMVHAPNVAAMRVCSCYGNNPVDVDDYWPYSVRVCLVIYSSLITCVICYFSGGWGAREGGSVIISYWCNNSHYNLCVYSYPQSQIITTNKQTNTTHSYEYVIVVSKMMPA